jgi:hypothetical protein
VKTHELPKPIQDAYIGQTLGRIRGGVSSTTEWYSFVVASQDGERHLWRFEGKLGWKRVRR